VFGVDLLCVLFSSVESTDTCYRASFFCFWGWLGGHPSIIQEHSNREGGRVDILTILKIWLYSFGVVVIILLVCMYWPSGLLSLAYEWV